MLQNNLNHKEEVEERNGGDGPGVKDSGGIGGGYSYDSGGRKGLWLWS